MAGSQKTDPARRGLATPSSAVTAAVDTTDWPVQAADAIERVVQGVRAKTTGPAINIVRWLVAGLFVVLAGTMVVVLAVVALIRLLDAYLPSSVFGDEHVWAAHGLIGLLLFLVGLVLLAKRHPRDDRH